MHLLRLEWDGAAVFYVGQQTAPLLLPPGSVDLEAVSVDSRFPVHLFKGMRNRAACPETSIPLGLFQYQTMQELHP